MKKSKAKLDRRKKVECPLCLYSSGILADGKGTKCRLCNGTGNVTHIEKIHSQIG